MSKLHLVWIGSVVPEDYYRKICLLGYTNQQASRNAQLNIIRGLELHYNTRFDFISGPAFPAYPKFKSLYVNPFHWQDKNGARGECASYLNIEYLNRLLKAKAMLRTADKITHSYSREDQIIVFANSPHTPFMKAALRVKKRFANSKAVLIIPDLPQYMESNISFTKRFLKSFDIKTINRLIPFFDYYVLYSAQMRYFLKLPPEKCVTMEGCASITEEEISKERNLEFTFMYSGKTDMKFGMKLLIEAFQKIKGNDCRLVITGEGDASSYLRQAEEKDHRIHYYGFIDDYSRVKKMQCDADIMLNMRLPSEIASNYCFPSKLFEYMKTGNPVISFKLGGIGKEYYEHLLVVEKENAVSLAQTMENAMCMSLKDRNIMGKKAYLFLKEKKNYIVQTKLIYQMLQKGLA